MNSISRYTPLSPGSRRDPFRREFDALVRSAFGDTGLFGSVGAEETGPSAFRPAAETLREGDDAIVRVELPGLDLAHDVDVEVTQGRLVIRGERRDERSEENPETGGTRLREIRYGRFERSFALPGHVGADAVTATYDAGVLSVRVAGVYAGSTPTRIAVTAAAPAQDSTEQATEQAQPGEQA